MKNNKIETILAEIDLKMDNCRELARAEVIKIATKELKNVKKLSAFRMAMGTYFFITKDGKIYNHLCLEFQDFRYTFLRMGQLLQIFNFTKLLTNLLFFVIIYKKEREVGYDKSMV